MSEFEVWPGPMEGVGSNEFVQAALALQLAPRWMTPFIRISENIPSAQKICRHIRNYCESGLPTVVQIMGNDPDMPGQCGRLILEKFPQVCGINLNCGCPSARVVSGNAGGGMLKAPERLAGFVSALAAYLPPGKLSVKIRAGFAEASDMEIFLPALADSGAVSKIFFHYRTVKELYSSAALPERGSRIARAVELCGNIPLIANGDIASVDEAENLVKCTGCAGVMIARPWMRDPFIFRRFSGDAPAPEAGRELFFTELQKAGVSGGALIESAKMLWGVNSERFRKIISKGEF